MSDVYTALIALVGPVPEGLEPYVYLFCCFLVLWLLNMLCVLISALFGQILK